MFAQDRSTGRLGPYRLLKKLGEGGMGVVYLAADPEQRQVAVKALRSAVASDPHARRRLAREVETMRRVRSPFVAEVIDADVTSEPPYIVTRYVPGRTLEAVVGEQGPLTGPALARVARGLAAAVQSVHAAGIVHRDIKPGNVMLADGEPVVIDFGIAQAPDSTRLTMTGMFMGTPGYLAPEVIEGKQSGPASDVHSWGATVAFAATGRPPYGGGSFETIFYRIVHGKPDLDGLPVPLFALVAQALSRDPARRPTAVRLSEQVAALDPAALVPLAVQGNAVGPLTAAASSTVADCSPAAGGAVGAVAGAVADGAGAAAPLAWPPLTRPLPGGGADQGVRPPGTPRGAGPNGSRADGHGPGRDGLAVRGPGGNGSAGPASPRTAAADVADLLPAASYPAPGSADGAAWPQRPGAGTAGPADAPQRGAAAWSAASPLLVAAWLAVLICVSIVLPAVGTLAAFVLLMLLRAGDASFGRLARRRLRRGARAGDQALAAAYFPGALAWSLARSVLMAPLALFGAGIVAAITIIAVPTHPIQRACAYAAGAIIAFYGLGPGSRAARRPVRSFFDAVAGNPLRAMALFVIIAALTVAAIVFAVTGPPVYWPFSHLGSWLDHTHVLHSVVHDIRTTLPRLVGRS